MCILFSEIGKHEDAEQYARNSAKLTVHALLETTQAMLVELIRNVLPCDDSSFNQVIEEVNRFSVQGGRSSSGKGSEASKNRA